MPLQFSLLLVITILLAACRPPELPTAPLPTDLRVSAQIDSIITSDYEDSFSQLSPVGKGPKGALIRYNYKSSIQNKSFTTLTYNEQNQLLGIFEYNEGYNQQVAEQAHYRGGYLANVWTVYLPSPPWEFPRSKAYLESLRKDLDAAQPIEIIKYQYNERKQLARVLFYQRITGTNNFKLYKLTANEYTYDSAGLLQKTRAITYFGSSTTTYLYTYHWQNGNVVRKEESSYPRPTIWANSDSVATTTYSYGKAKNPFAGLTFLPNSDGFLSQHDRTSSTDYAGVITRFNFTYQYDSQGRVVSRGIGDEKGTTSWSGYSFEYAP